MKLTLITMPTYDVVHAQLPTYEVHAEGHGLVAVQVEEELPVVLYRLLQLFDAHRYALDTGKGISIWGAQVQFSLSLCCCSRTRSWVELISSLSSCQMSFSKPSQLSQLYLF